MPVPVTDPPYDDELERPGEASGPLGQESLGLAFVLPGGAPAVPEPSAQLRLIESPSPRRAADRTAAEGDAAEGDAAEGDAAEGDTASGTHHPSDHEARPVHPEEQDVTGFAARRATEGAALPDPRRWTAQLAQAVAEVTTGHRPVHQLMRWTDEDVYETLGRRAASAHRRPAPTRPVVRALRLSHPRDGVVEAGVVVQAGRRCRGLALRLEGLDGRWRCTAIELL